MYDISFYIITWSMMFALAIPIVIGSTIYAMLNKKPQIIKKDTSFKSILHDLKKYKANEKKINIVYEQFQNSHTTFSQDYISENTELLDDIFYELSINKAIDIDNLVKFYDQFSEHLDTQVQKAIQKTLSKGLKERENLS